METSIIMVLICNIWQCPMNVHHVSKMSGEELGAPRRNKLPGELEGWKSPKNHQTGHLKNKMPSAKNLSRVLVSMKNLPAQFGATFVNFSRARSMHIFVILALFLFCVRS